MTKFDYLWTYRNKTLLAWFHDKVSIEFGTGLRFKKYLEIRFTGVITVLERVVRLWDVLESLYIEKLGTKFPLEGKYEILTQLVGLLTNLKWVKTHSHTTSHPASCTTLLELVDFYLIGLEEGSPIKLGQRGEICGRDIHPIVEKTRERLRIALKARFFDRYSSSTRGSGKPAQSLLMEKATVMHPQYKKLDFLKELGYEKVVDIIKKCHQEVFNLAVEAYQKENLEICERMSDMKIDYLSLDNQDIDPRADKESSNLVAPVNATITGE